MNTTFEKAKAFIYRNARPLDLARFQYHFENSSKEIADYECEYIINTQLADGSWNIGWTWGGNYPDEWAISKNWWKGQLIIQNLLYLKWFGLL